MHYVFRDTADVNRLRDLIEKRGLRIVAGEAANIPAEMLSAIQELERKRVGERLAAGRAAKRVREGFCGGSDPYGYRRRGDELQPDEREQSILRLAAELWPENSLRQICKRLSYLGFNNRNGSPFHPQTIARILARTGE